MCGHGDGHHCSGKIDELGALRDTLELGALRDTLRYSGNELLVQRAFVEGWDRNKIIAEGIQGDMDNHSLNSRNEL
eukprot:SAG11_NODE_36830_length_259_cov_1.906250_1_plen_75_part_01